MSVLRNFAEWFKSRKVPIARWYEDDVGAYAFRVKIDGITYICSARKSHPAKGRVSCFRRIPTIAKDKGGYVLLRIQDDMLVFDPVKIMANGKDSSNQYDPKRARRGERWVEFDTEWGVEFAEFYDGDAEPPGPSGLDQFK